MRDALNGNLGLENKKVGMLIFLASEIMFFTGLLGAYIVIRKTASAWPEVSSVLNLPIGFVNTAVLFLSSLLFQFSLTQSRAGKEQTAKTGWVLTLLLAGIFLAAQFFEYHTLWTVKDVRISNGLFGASFYVMTALHALHLLAGVLCLTVFLMRSKKVSTFETLGLYWHFVGMVWLVLFTVLYLIA